MATNKKQRRRLRIGRLFLLLFMLFAFIGAGATVGIMAGLINNLDDLDVAGTKPETSTIIYDMHGNIVDRLHAGENRELVKFANIPQTVKDAFLATEDRNFENHRGFDPRGILRALVVDITTGTKSQGASTITQQLARTAYLKDNSKTIQRKLQELIVAIQLERTYTKDEIFEKYLNWVYFGEGAHGIQAAAQTFFGKNVQELSLAESAMLAGMVKSPGGRYSPFRNLENAINRRNTVLNNMYKNSYITEEQYKEALATPYIQPVKGGGPQRKYAYFVDYVASTAEKLLEERGLDSRLLYTGGLRVYTTIDARIQDKMEEVFANPNNFPKPGPERIAQAAMVVIDHRTGEIRGMMGGREYTTRKGLNRAVQSDRQPGSTIKPLVVYGPALEKGFTVATVLDDSPVTYPGNPPYSPNNYDGKFRGLITMREALQWSVNIPAVKMLHTLGVDTGFQFGKKLGLPLANTDRNLSLALGGLTTGVSPLNMASAYGAFANQGVLVQPHAIIKITDSQGKVLIEFKPKKEMVMTEQTAFLMTDMLQTVVDAGTGTRAKLNRPVAGKTGTTQLPPHLAKMNLKGVKDAWFVGYTPELVAAVWMGFDVTDAKHFLQHTAGGSFPAMIWKAVVGEGLKDVPVTQFNRPQGIVYAAVDSKSGLLPSEFTPEKFIVNEVFTKETVPQVVSQAWISAQVCAETGQLPSPYCPDIITGVFLQRQIPWDREATPPMDANLEAPTEVCTIHGPGTGYTTATVCNDPRHSGTTVLALIPGPGQTGGCPPELLSTRGVPNTSLSGKQCDIPEHQLKPIEQSIPASAGGNGNNRTSVPPKNTNGAVQKAPPSPVLKGSVGRQNEPPGQWYVSLAWEMPPGTQGLIYAVERRVEGNPTRYNLALTSGLVYKDDKVEIDGTYYYRILAIDSQSNLSTPSNEIKMIIKN